MIVALFILTQALAVEVQIEDKKDIQEQGNSEKHGKQQQITEFITSFQVSLDYRFHLLGQVFTQEEEESDQRGIKERLFSIQKAIKVILRWIILPNAP